MLRDPAIEAIARAHDRTAAQIVLRWHVQSGYVPAPKSANAERQADNLAIFDFALSDDEMACLNGLGRPDPTMKDADEFGH